MNNNSQQFIPDYPEDATIRYGTPHYSCTSTYWRRDLSLVETEEKARSIAAGWGGNGSGTIIKKVTYDTHYTDGKTTGNAEFEFFEELEPVTVFDEDGQKRRMRYLAIIECKHPKKRTRNYGAGCQKWEEDVCSSCGKVV